MCWDIHGLLGYTLIVFNCLAYYVYVDIMFTCILLSETWLIIWKLIIMMRTVIWLTPNLENRQINIVILENFLNTIKKAGLKNFPIFTGKHLCWSLFVNKVVGLRLAALLKKRLRHSFFPLKFVIFLRTSFYRTPPVAASEGTRLAHHTKIIGLRPKVSLTFFLFVPNNTDILWLIFTVSPEPFRFATESS